MSRVQKWTVACAALALAVVTVFARGAVPSEGLTPLRSGPALDQKLAVGDISISYPTGLESQAQQVAEVCKTVVAPRLEEFREMECAFSDPKRVAAALTTVLGWEESDRDLDLATAVAGAGQVMAFFEPMFMDVRIYREKDLRSSGGVNNGAIRLSYDQATDKVQFSINFQMSGRAAAAAKPTEARAFLPVVVKDDGSFRGEKGLAAHMSEVLDGLASSLALRGQFAFLRATASLLLFRRCGGDPFVWWFIDGAAQWATLRLVQDLAPEYASECREMLLAEAPTPEGRARVNLPAWPAGEDPTPREARDEESVYCAHELIDRLLRDRPEGTLAAVLGKLKRRKAVNTDTILGAFDAVLGGDSRSLLLEYVPEAVRIGLKDGRARKLREEGYQALHEGDLLKALRALSHALEMTPSDADMRVNLAIAMRREGTFPKWASERQIRLAAALARAQDRREFAVEGKTDDETWYVLGRIAQVREQNEEARALLGRLPPSHADGQAALKEIEAGVRPAGGGEQR